MDDLASELRALFQTPLTLEALHLYSTGLQREYRDKLRSSDISMLPSYNHTLPSGSERGKCLALDVGGSTFRVAMVELVGREAPECIRTSHSQAYVIDGSVKRLRGQQFFNWMADRIQQTLTSCAARGLYNGATLPMGLAWSFPIQQTDPRTGNLLAMGKGFNATYGLEGQDLSTILMRSCLAADLNVEMRAIVNDGAATLLSQAYRDSSTRMSLILGTGMNSAAFLPVTTLGPEKLGNRPESWHQMAKHVLINTELSMFGKGIMPVTRWDEQLNRDHQLPDFQPMEYLCTGMYIGEIVRLILLEAIDTTGLFGGEWPARFSTPYSLDTRIVAAFDSDETANLSDAWLQFCESHPLSVRPPRTDLRFVQTVARLVSQRAQTYIAVAIHALWMVRTISEGLLPTEASELTVACNGTVIEKYPGFRFNCQRVLDELCISSGAPAGTINLQMASESSIYGAAVAVACITDT